jgi:hypothetical protein
MRFKRTTRTLFALSLVAGTAMTWVGCSPKKQTELVPGVSTQVKVPKELKSIRVDAVVGGQNVFCGVYDVVNGYARLPRTLALQSTGKTGGVTVYVTGFRAGTLDPEATQDQQACAITPIPTVKDLKNVDGTSRVLRAAKTNYRQDHVLYLPMPLKFSCFDKGCPIDQNQVCKAGKCVAMDVDETKLPEYNDNLVFGNSSTCFSPQLCLADAVLPEVVDAASCQFALWKSPGAPDAGADIPFVTNGSGLNVRVFYDDGSVSEVLDYDQDEGFYVPHPDTAPQIFQLADGLCHPDADAPHKVTAIVASGLCASKTPYQPLCDEESPSNPDSDASTTAGDDGGSTCTSIEIKPAPSALVVLMDDTTQMQSFFGADAAKKVLELSLGDPVFEKADLVFAFTPGKTTCGGAFTPELSGKTVIASQNDIATLIASKDPTKLSTDPRALAVALDGAYTRLGQMAATALANKTPYNRLAVLALGDGTFTDDCGGAPKDLPTISHAAAADGVATYTVLFGRQDLASNPTGLANAGAIQTSGFYNADSKTGGDPNNAGQALAQVTQDLASCVYDAPPRLAGTGDVVYVDPLPPAQRVRIPYNATCSATNDTSGWNQETVFGGSVGRVRLCGTDCSNLQAVLKNTAGLALKANQPPPAIPIYVQTCTGQPPTPQADGGGGPKDSGPVDSGGTPDTGTDSGITDAGADG